jgi:hypothetical protein
MLSSKLNLFTNLPTSAEILRMRNGPTAPFRIHKYNVYPHRHCDKYDARLDNIQIIGTIVHVTVYFMV